MREDRVAASTAARQTPAICIEVIRQPASPRSDARHHTHLAAVRTQLSLASVMGRGRKPFRVVPCTWQATPSIIAKIKGLARVSGFTDRSLRPSHLPLSSVYAFDARFPASAVRYASVRAGAGGCGIHGRVRTAGAGAVC